MKKNSKSIEQFFSINNSLFPGFIFLKFRFKSLNLLDEDIICFSISKEQSKYILISKFKDELYLKTI